MNHDQGPPVQQNVIVEGLMLGVLGVMAAAVFVMLAFPKTEIGQVLKHWLVEAPARRLNRLPHGKAAFYGGLALLGLALTLSFEVEGARLFGFLLPDTLVWFAMFDVGVFIDALLITGAIAASNGLRVVRAQVAMARQRLFAALTPRASARAPRVRIPAKRPALNSADEDDTRWAQPAYLALSMA